MKQVFKNEVLTSCKVRNNILRTYSLSKKEDRYDWYKEARDFSLYLSAMNGLPLEVTTGVIAALSPVKSWEENKKLAEQFLKTGNCGHLGAMKAKARMIVELEQPTRENIVKILRGRKISAFFLNILGDKQVVTIDRHALSIALGRRCKDSDYQGLTDKQYNFFVWSYQLAAQKLNISPARVQSSTWVIWRKLLKS